MLLRFGFILETLGLYTLFWLIGASFTEDRDWAYLGYMLHPYLLIIMLEAIHYGRNEAMFAAGVGAAAYIARMTQLGIPLHEDKSAHVVIIFSMIATGFVLGSTQQARNRQLAHTRNELEDVRAEAERQRQRINVLTAANRELNDRILGEVSTVQSFSDLARRLSVLEEKDLYPAICELICDYLGASEASVYALKGNHLVLTSARGWDQIPEEARTLPEGKDLLWETVRRKQTVTARDVDVPRGSESDPSRRYRHVMCAPLINASTGNVTGVISVDAIPFARFHGLSLKVLAVIARWASDSLYNATMFRGVTAQLVGDELMEDCLPPVLFRDRLEKEASDEKGGHGILSVRLQGLGELAPREQKELRKNLYQSLRQIMTGTDILGRLQEGHYGVLLNREQDVTFNLQQTLLDALRRELKPQLSAANGTLKVRVGASQFNGAGGDLDVVLQRLSDNMVDC
ncbi:MAG: GAF domain-containing protein [Candidatus Eremiobacterota bacterium]